MFGFDSRNVRAPSVAALIRQDFDVDLLDVPADRQQPGRARPDDRYHLSREPEGALNCCDEVGPVMASHFWTACRPEAFPEAVASADFQVWFSDAIVVSLPLRSLDREFGLCF